MSLTVPRESSPSRAGERKPSRLIERTPIRTHAKSPRGSRRESSGTKARNSWKRGGSKAVILTRLEFSHENDTNLHPADDFMIENALVQVPIFSNCSQDFITALSVVSQSHRLSVGNVVATQDNPASSMVVVLQGSIDVLLGDARVAVLNPGQHFGETFLLGLESAWTVSLKVSRPCVICEITIWSFQSVCASHPIEKRFFGIVAATSQDCLSEGTLVKTCVVFHGLSETTMCAIDASLVRRLYFPGQPFLQEGMSGDELYILVRGDARIEKAGRLVKIEKCSGSIYGIDDLPEDTPRKSGEKTDGLACFGELGLLGMQATRTATVSADSVCHLRVLYRPAFLKILEDHNESMQMSNLMKLFEHRGYRTDGSAVSYGQMLAQVPIFKQVGCSQGFIDFLADHLEDKIFVQGQRIIDEDNPDDRCMYLISRGVARVTKEGKEVALLRKGSVVGEVIVLGLATKRTASVIAQETCFLHVLYQSVVVRGLELFPQERSKVLQMAFNVKESQAQLNFPHEPGEETPKMMSPEEERAAMAKGLKNSPMLADVEYGFIEQLSIVASPRIFMPGDLIVQQGVHGDSMFIMISGTALVYASDPEAYKPEGRARVTVTGCGNGGMSKREKTMAKQNMAKVGAWTSGSVGGELSMLGISPVRTATIEAETICSMWEITSEDTLPILSQYPDAQRHFADVIVDHLERTVPTRIANLPLFDSFDRKFRTLLAIYCERSVYFPSQQIAREGQHGEYMHVINLGRVRLEKNGVTVKMYAAGSHFGSTVMLGIHKVYFGTLVALQTCHVLGVSQNAYQASLEQYPQLRVAKALNKKEKRITEALRDAAHRTAIRKLIYKRSQTLTQDTVFHTFLHAAPGTTHGSVADIQERYLKAWHERVNYVRQRRVQLEREHSQRITMMNKWVQRKAQAIEHAQTLRETLHGWPSQNCMRCEEGEMKLPQILPSFVEKSKLTRHMKCWPNPKPSPHYELRVFDVLSQATASATAALEPVLMNDITTRSHGSMGDTRHKFPTIDSRPSGFQGLLPFTDANSGCRETETSDVDVAIRSDSFACASDDDTLPIQLPVSNRKLQNSYNGGVVDVMKLPSISGKGTRDASSEREPPEVNLSMRLDTYNFKMLS